MQPINEAVSIMVVGMITVFFILFLIVAIGEVIIRLSNKYIPVEEANIKTKKNNDASINTFAAIEAAIDIATKGKAKVINIKKLDI